jgi:hypothetical protein
MAWSAFFVEFVSPAPRHQKDLSDSRDSTSGRSWPRERESCSSIGD